MSGPDSDGTTTAPDGDAPPEAADVASAGRSCLVILVLGAILVLVLCVGLSARWALT